MVSRLDILPERKDELLTMIADGRRRAILTALQDVDDRLDAVRTRYSTSGFTESL